MDINKDGVIGWDEFEVFMTEEFTAGKSLLSGEYLLPSGTSLNFGVMIGKLKRNKLLRDIMEVRTGAQGGALPMLYGDEQKVQSILAHHG